MLGHRQALGSFRTIEALGDNVRRLLAPQLDTPTLPGRCQEALAALQRKCPYQITRLRLQQDTVRSAVAATSLDTDVRLPCRCLPLNSSPMGPDNATAGEPSQAQHNIVSSHACVRACVRKSGGGRASRCSSSSGEDTARCAASARAGIDFAARQMRCALSNSARGLEMTAEPRDSSCWAGGVGASIAQGHMVWRARCRTGS